jgi:MFS family permease
MHKIMSASKQKNFIMLLVVIFIFADIVCDNYLGIIYDKRPGTQQFFFFLAFALLQILFAPLQSGLSDLYGRKKSLIVALSFSLLSLIFLAIFNLKTTLFPFLILATIAKGAVGNTLPISLAVIADTQDKNHRLSFAFSTAAYAFAYLTLASANEITSENQLNYFLIIFFVLIILACINLFSDFEGRGKRFVHRHNSISSTLRNEKNLIIKDLKNSSTTKALAAFFLWEISLYSILLTQVDFQLNKATHIAQAMMCGYLLGVTILIFCQKAKDSKIIKIGYFTSCLSLIPYFLLYKIVADKNHLIKVCYFFHSLGNAFLSPALLSILAKEREKHERGRIYGLLDSADTCAYLFAAIAIIVYTALRLDLVYLISFSFFTFTISWIFYNRFQNIKE